MEIMNMKLKMMSTLWENTYRVAIEDGHWYMSCSC